MTAAAADRLPRIIQGGMGVGVSGWRLASAVARTGQLGVVSGSLLDTVLVRRLQDGDPGGHVRRAAAHCPIPGVADDVLRRWYRAGGRAPGASYRLLSMYRQHVSDARQRVTVLANFVEVWLAREGHDNPVGINLLTKVQMPNLASLYGAMLAGVGYVIMGAGIPREIPGVLDALAEHRPARLRFDVDGLARDEEQWLDFDPAAHWPQRVVPDALARPRFLAVVSATSLATTLARKSTGRVDGFVVEGPTAGGHNAPPRGELRLDERGQPLYGDRDAVDLAKIRELGLPFWLAGGVGSASGLRRALDAGAIGVQVGTLFAYAEESGIEPSLRERVRDAVVRGEATLRTDPRASPTGYPFKIVELPGDADRAARRTRVCDLGYLRVAVRLADGRTVYRCSAEPVDDYVAKGGDAADAEGRRCLCNGLSATIGLAQSRDASDTGSGAELPLVTSGDDLLALAGLFAARPAYTAADVVEMLVS
ncbi:MAG TPA: nitronate monooxygenase [Gemmatimonadaceae bacterium]|nr:nitronate monooxygenase [Gemmatimonadaceae bacterium]